MRDQSGIPTALSIAEERLKKVYPLVVLALFGVALIVLYRQFHTLDLQAVSAAIVATGTSQMAWAIGLTAAGYITLIGYDRLALAYIGRSIPLPTVAAASFVGYAVGNTVGLSALSGGAIRYRIYSRYGLDAADIAKIALYCALAFSSGEMLSALFVTAAEPGAATMLLPLSPGVLRGLAIAALVAMLAGAFFLSIGGLSFSIGHFHFRMPEWPLLASQIVLSLADLSLASAVLYALLPPEAGISWIAFLGLFVVAVAAGVLSHVPGGAGVFEAVMAAGLAGSVPHASPSPRIARSTSASLKPSVVSTIASRRSRASGPGSSSVLKSMQ